MIEHSVRLTAVADPDPIMVSEGDSVVWSNDSGVVQTVTSDDGGQTFTTGPVQNGSNSLPIRFQLASPGVAYTTTTGIRGIVVVEPAASDVGVVSFAARIKPYFTKEDRNAMNDADHTLGVIVFDLWSRDDVRANWDVILSVIIDQRMPPAGTGSGPWSNEKITQFLTDFTAWKDGGFQP